MFNVPMIPFAALDSNSLMNQLGSPRIIGSYDSCNIMNMPSAYSRPMLGSMGGMNMNSAMGLVGAAGLGFAAASMMNNNNGGGMSGIADSLGITNPNRPAQQNNYNQPNAYNQPAQPNAYGQPNAYNQPTQTGGFGSQGAGRPISQDYGQPVQQNYPQNSPQYGYQAPQNNYMPAQDGLTNTAYNTGSDMTAVFNSTAQPAYNASGNVQPAYSSMGSPNPAPQPAYNPNAATSFNPNPAMNSAPAPQPAYNPNAATSFDPNPAMNSTHAPQPAAPKPKINRRRAPAEGKAVVKGQKFALEAPGEPPLDRVKICLGWETANDRCELDASAFMLGANEKVPSDEYFIFYGQPSSPDRSVNYKVFDTDPNNCDDAAVEIDLANVDPRVGKIAVAITIYEAFERKLNFGMVPMVYARIVNSATGKEIARFELTERNSAVTALVVGELYRYKGSWKFNAVGSGVNRDLAGFCGMYGVALV